jgi:hypothetical protein
MRGDAVHRVDVYVRAAADASVAAAGIWRSLRVTVK